MTAGDWLAPQLDREALNQTATTATPEYDVPMFEPSAPTDQTTDMKKPAPRAWRLQGGPDHKEQERTSDRTEG